MLPNEEKGISDEEVDGLVDRHLNSDVRFQADKNKAKLSKEQFHKYRARAKKDLFFLCASILGNTRLSVDLHGDLCEHIRKTANDRFHLFLYPRGNFKTTIITIGHSIQLALPYTKEDAEYDEDPSPLPYPANLGTNLRLLIAHETHESASRFLFAISNHILTNPILMALFPEIVPTPRSQRINKTELELPRTLSGKPEPTFDTLGVGGKSQGRHYNYIKLDDIFGDKARDSELEASTTIDWFDNIQAFFDVFRKDHLDLTGTRYSYDDVYSHAMETYGSQLVKKIRKLEEPDGKGGIRISFPEEFTPESIAIIKKNKKIYAAQYQNDPEDSVNGFDPTWRKYYNWLDVNRIVVFTGKDREIIEVRDLDVCILIDPGESKSGGYVVTGMDHKGRIFILSAILLESTPDKLTDYQFMQVIRWQARTTAIESDFFMNVFQYWWRREMLMRGHPFHITPVHTKQKAKNDRISGLSNYFSSGMIYMNEAQEDLENEYRRWGKSKSIHILDALAYGPEVWRPGMAPGMRKLINDSADLHDDQRDVETGYSQIA